MVSDHYGHIKEYERAGIPVYAPFLDGEPPRGMVKRIWNYAIKTFENPHGETTSYGFYIKHPEMGKLLFLTDFEYCRYDFSALQVEHLMIEANYDVSLLDMDAPNFKHKVQGHCSLDTCKEFVRHNNSPHLRTVCLIHSNPMTLDETDAIRQIKGIVDADVNVVIAEPGMEIELKKEVF